MKKTVFALFVWNTILNTSFGGSKAIVVVVSPLKALMLDQVRVFSAKGLESAYVSGNDEGGDIASGVENGDYTLMLMSPRPL